MKKEKISKFIDLYYLGGLINDAVWTVKTNTATVKLLTEDKTLMGSVSMDNVDLDDSEFAIRDTAGLINIIKPMDNEIELQFETQNNINKSLLLNSTGTFNINSVYPLGDISVMPKTGSLKKTPDFQIEIELTEELVNKIISIKNSVDSKTFTFYTENDKLYLIVGYVSDIQTNRTKIELNAKFIQNIDLQHKSYSADNLKNILTANKGFKSGKLSIFDGGLANAHFEHEEMNSDYYLIQLKTV